MKIITLNIRFGGGNRADRIAEYLATSNCDIIVLTEFERIELEPSRKIMLRLQEEGYNILFSPCTTWSADAILIASKESFETKSTRTGWVEIFIPKYNITTLGIYMKWASSNPDDRRKINNDEFWDSILYFAESNRDKSSLIVGDFNSYLKEDSEEGIECNEGELIELKNDLKWVDMWDDFNKETDPKNRYTFENIHEKGVRLDYCFGSPHLLKNWKVNSVIHYQNTRIQSSEPALTDHSSVIVEIEPM